MKILFLGSNTSKDLPKWLVSKGEDVIYVENKIDINYVKIIKPDFIISYNYHYIISKEIIDFVKGKIINLHISYLPWNRGAYPNVWSFLEDTSKGVSIIKIDEGIDTGEILVQKEVIFQEEETLKSSYEKLHKEIQELFKKNWDKIKREKIKCKKQEGIGSIHYAREYESIIEPLIKKEGLNISIKEIKQEYTLWKNKKYGRKL